MPYIAKHIEEITPLGKERFYPHDRVLITTIDGKQYREIIFDIRETNIHMYSGRIFNVTQIEEIEKDVQ